MAATYETDFVQWTREQADKLRRGSFEELDTSNLAEEIEDLGKSQRRAFESCLVQLIKHLLKWDFQPNLRGRSWSLSIRKQRRKIARILSENPSLHSLLENSEFLSDVYTSAVDDALIETDLAESGFPPTCPYPLADLLAEK